MGVHRRRDLVKAGGVIGLVGLAGCTTSDDESDTLEDVIDEVHRYQKERLDDYNMMVRSDSFDHEETLLETVPSQLKDATTVEYNVTVGTDAEGPYADLTDTEEMPRGDVERAIATETGMSFVIDPHLYIPITGIDGEGDIDTEAYQQYADTLGRIGVELTDHAGNAATLEVPEDDVKDLWRSVESSLENDQKSESAREIRFYARENMKRQGWNKLPAEILEDAEQWSSER